MAGNIDFGIRLTADGSAYVGTVRLAAAETEKLGVAARLAGQGVSDLGHSMTSAVALGSAFGTVLASGAAALVRWAFGTVTAASELKNLSDITGSTVESLSQLTNVAKVSGVGAGALSTALERLAVGLSGTDEQSKAAGKALSALGIASRDPAQAMTELAKKFAGYADDANKAAYANAVFGRGGAQLLPLLKDIAEQQGIAATVTTKQAQEAENLEKALRKLRGEGDALTRALLGGLVPALNELLKALQGNGRGEKLGILSITPADRANLEGAITQTKAAIEQVGKLKAALETPSTGVFGTIAAWLSKDDLAIANKQLEAMTARLKELNALANSANPDRNIHMNADRYVASLKPSLGATRTGGGGSKTEVDEYAKALANVGKIAADAQLALEGLFAPDLLTRANKALTDLEASPAWAKINKAGQEQLKVLFGQAAAIELQTKKWEDLAKAAAGFAAQQADERKKWDDELKQNAEQIDALVQKLGLETETMFMTNDERERAIALAGILYKSETDYEAQVKRVNDAFNARNGAAELKQQLKEQAEEWKKAYDGISNTITDALMRGFEGGKDWAQNFVQTLKNMFATLVLRPIIQAAVAPVAGGLASLIPGSAGASGSAGGAGSLLNLTSLFGGTGGFGTALGAGYSAGLDTLGIAASAGADAVGGIGSVLGAGTAVAGPYIAAALAGYALFKAFSKKGGGPKVGGTAGYANYYPGETQEAGNAIAQAGISGNQASYASYLAALGGKGSAQFALGFSTDPKGTAQSAVSAGALVDGRTVYASHGIEAGRDDATLQAALTLESKRALLAALQASDLPASIAKLLNTLTASSANSEAIDNALKFADAMGQIIKTLGGNVIEDAQTAWNTSQKSSTESLRAMGAEVTKLAGQLDGSAESMQSLATATGNYRQAVVQTLVAIKQAQQQLAQAFAGTREQIQFAGLGKEDSYNLYRSKAATLLTQIGQSDDPAAIKAMGDKLNGYFVAAFNALSPEDQVLHKQEFLNALTDVDASINTKLTDISKVIGTDTTGPFAAAQAALDDAASKFGKAADKQGEAAETSSKAASAMASAASAMLAAASAPINVVVTSPGGGEIGGG